MVSWFAVKVIAQVFSLLVGYYTFKKKSVSLSGLVSLLLISALFIWLGHVGLLAILFYMFATSSFLTKFKKQQKKEFEKVVSKTGPRDYKQALANLGIAVLCMFFYHLNHHPAWLAAFIGSVAAANADSWASEIGGLSHARPILITNFKPVEKGISGGITWMGIMGGIMGSFFISGMAFATLKLSSPENQLLTSPLYFSVTLAGIAGFLLDSYIGATVQALYRNNVADRLTESKGKNHILIKGFSWINNDLVNLITTILSAGIAAALFMFLT